MGGEGSQGGVGGTSGPLPIDLTSGPLPIDLISGPVMRNLVRAKSGPGGPLLAAKSGPGCQTWSGYIKLQETVPRLQKFV